MQYQVETLKAICDKVLSMNMNNKNAADMCRLSVMLNTNCLQEKSFAFLHKYITHFNSPFANFFIYFSIENLWKISKGWKANAKTFYR